MIAKKIPRRDPRGRTAAEQIVDLVGYVLAGGRHEADKLVAAGSYNFIADSAAARLVEMQALAACCPKSPMPLSHWVLSWPSAERPTVEQIEQAARMFVEEIGFGGHQFFWGIHGNTDNLHCHVALNRVHPDTEKVAKPNKGFDRLAAQRALTKIEATFGWRPEDGALYQMDGDHVVPRDAWHAGEDVLTTGEMARKASQGRKPVRGQDVTKDATDDHGDTMSATTTPKIGYGARGSEIRTGKKSTQRVAQDSGVAATILRAGSWSEMHAMLAYVHSAAYVPAGGGASIVMGGRAVKSSSISRDITPRALEKRFGPFQPPAAGIASDIEAAASEPRAAEFIDPLAAIFDAERRASAERKADAKAALDADIKFRRKQLGARHDAAWAEFKSTSWKGKGAACNIMRAGIAMHHKAERAALQAEINDWRAEWRERFPEWPDLASWKARREASRESASSMNDARKEEHHDVYFEHIPEAGGAGQTDLIQLRIDAALAQAGGPRATGWTAAEIREKLAMIIDDMDAAGAGVFIEDGWAPCLVRETGPGRRQAVLLADRPDGVEDGVAREAAAALSRQLADRYATLTPVAAGETWGAARVVEAARTICTRATAAVAEIAATLLRGEDPRLADEDDDRRRGGDAPSI